MTTRAEEQAIMRVFDQQVDLAMTEGGWAREQTGTKGEDGREDLRRQTDDGSQALWYRWPAAGDFVLRAVFTCDRDMDPEATVLVSAAVKISHRSAEERSRALWPFADCGVLTGIIDLPRLTVPPDERGHELPVADATQAGDVGTRLAAVIVAHAAAWGEPLGDVDALVEAMREAEEQDDEPVPVRMGRSVILGSVGRIGDAQSVLAGELRARGEASRHFQENVEAVTRWLADGATGVISPRPKRRPAPPDGIGGAVGDARRHARREREARAAVQARGTGESREELRAIAESELAAREIELGPLALERFLDSVEGEPVGRRLRLGLAGLKLAAGKANDLRTAVTTGDATGLVPPVPPGCGLPDDAVYPASRSDDLRQPWIGVTLDPSADALLVDLIPDPSAGLGILSVRGWLSTEEQTTGTSPTVAVHVGRQRVGRILPPAAARYQEDLRLASSLGLAPVVDLHLVRRQRAPLFLVEIRPPAPELTGP